MEIYLANVLLMALTINITKKVNSVEFHWLLNINSAIDLFKFCYVEKVIKVSIAKKLLDKEYFHVLI